MTPAPGGETRLRRGMNTASTRSFRDLHDDLLLLPCAWDAASAALLGDLGFEAIGTTSAGMAWSLGRPDGSLLRDDVLEATKRITAATSAMVSADIEHGYSASVSEVAALVLELATLGVVGVNIEDSTSSGQRAGDEFAEWLSGVVDLVRPSADVVVNARVDTWLTGGSGELGYKDAVSRARLYEQAGADGIFIPAVPSVRDAALVVRSVGLPVNVMATAGGPTLAEWRAVGVRRVSTGMGLAQSAFGELRLAARAWREDSASERDPGVDFAELQLLLGRRVPAESR